MHYGDSKDFSPSNAWNDSKTAVLRQLPRPAAAVPVITRGQRQCRYTEWVSVGIQTVPRGSVIAPMGLRQCKLALARTQGCTLHCTRLRSPECKFALQRMQTCAAADPALHYANCKLAHCIVHGDGTNGGFASIAAPAETQITHRVYKVRNPIRFPWPSSGARYHG